KPGLGKVWALRIKKGCASILTQPLFIIGNSLSLCREKNGKERKLFPIFVSAILIASQLYKP
ncbi:hypothetical protein, partial [Bacteroides cellulosilyticus]